MCKRLCCCQVERLEAAVKDSESGLGSASVHINNLKEASVRLKQELDNSRAELKQAKASAAKLQVSCKLLVIGWWSFFVFFSTNTF